MSSERPPEALTRRETQVLDGIARGLTNAEIGRELGLSHNTVRSYVESILEKTGARNRTEAAVRYHRQQEAP